MLDQRRRRWANIGQTLGRCVVFAGIGFTGTPYICLASGQLLYFAEIQGIKNR